MNLDSIFIIMHNIWWLMYLYCSSLYFDNNILHTTYNISYTKYIYFIYYLYAYTLCIHPHTHMNTHTWNLNWDILHFNFYSNLTHA